ncbi:VOC family protein [Streptomyces sp. NBC_01497]|uniref:VOC family protein n=1 Tax=Streptomyces sp. NBC_01497 TaxID=2903885 RepID=UPI002E3031EF|nr:VOC family protein [Streptomyces sp. NBC_01497]
MAAFAEGTPCWLDVSLPDLEAGKRFYGDLFGWTFGRGPGPGPAPERGTAAYVAAFSDGSRVAGLVAKRDGRMPTAWGVYFATPDVVDAARRVVAAGGRMVREPVRMDRVGVVALAADPGGAVFGLWQSEGQAPGQALRDVSGDEGAGGAEGDGGAEGSGSAVGAGAAGNTGAAGSAGEDVGFERQGEPGSFCWTEVYTRAPEAVDAFYERVLHVSGSDATGTTVEAVPFRLWSPKGATPGPGTAIGGRSVMTDVFPAELPGHFLNYFAVTDCDATAAAVVRLGGRVRQAPFDITYGRMAVLTDNQGADFAVLAERALSAEAAGEARGPEAPETAEGPEGAARPQEAAETEAGEEGAAAPKRRWGRRRS